MSLIENILNKLNIGGSNESSTYTVALIILSIAVVLFVGFILTRLTKLLKLPNVTAYIISGVLIGPSVFNIIPETFIEKSEFLSDIALAFIAFSAGEFFKISSLKKAGFKPVIITLFESLLTFVFVFVVMAFIARIDISFSIVLAALSSATAPASTLMTIRQTKAKGEYVDTLLEVIALDDVIAIILYSVSISLCIGLKRGKDSISFMTIGWLIIRTFICAFLGLIFGVLLRLFLPKSRTTDNRLIIVIAILFSFCGICSLFNESPLLGCMMIGLVYTNMMDEDDKLFKQVNYFSPPIMLIFFVRSGMNFKISSFKDSSSIGSVSLIAIALIYLLIRIIGKYSGAYLGSLTTKSNKSIRNYLGLALIPQAGVAIGLAQMGSRIFIDSGEVLIGNALNTIILSSSILYELIGPVSAKLGLYLSKSYSNNIDEVVPIDSKSSPVERLVKQINEIRKENKLIINENEEAFTKAAVEYDDLGLGSSRFMHDRRK